MEAFYSKMHDFLHSEQELDVLKAHVFIAQLKAKDTAATYRSHLHILNAIHRLYIIELLQSGFLRHIRRVVLLCSPNVP